MEEISAYFADFPRQPEWDETVTKTELLEPSDEAGIGARWKTFERLDSLQSDQGRTPRLHNGRHRRHGGARDARIGALPARGLAHLPAAALVFKGLDPKQQAQRQASLENVKTMVERASVSNAVAVTV